MTDFPTKTLMIPPLGPLAVCAVTQYIEWKGHHFNVHGDFILVVAASLFTGVIAILIEGFAVPHAWRLLRVHPALRTPMHCIALGIGALYLLVCFSIVAWGIIAVVFIA